MNTELDKYLDLYYQHFGKDYEGIGFWNDKPDKEMIEEIKECIKSNKPQEIPEFNEHELY